MNKWHCSKSATTTISHPFCMLWYLLLSICSCVHQNLFNTKETAQGMLVEGRQFVFKETCSISSSTTWPAVSLDKSCAFSKLQVPECHGVWLWELNDTMYVNHSAPCPTPALTIEYVMVMWRWRWWEWRGGRRWRWGGGRWGINGYLVMMCVECACVLRQLFC